MPVGDDQSTKAAKALALPTRSAIFGHLLKVGSLTAREVAEEFGLHPNVARAHLDLLVEAGFLTTSERRQGKGRPAKVYLSWEGEMATVEDWEVSPPSAETPERELIASQPSLPVAAPPSPYRLISAIMIRLVERLDPKTIYPLAEKVAREEGRKLVLGYRAGGLDFAAAIRALVEEFRRFSPRTEITRLEHDYAEVETPDCPFKEIALEHSDLVSIMDPALYEGALEGLGMPSEVDLEMSVARGDPHCRLAITRKAARKSSKKTSSKRRKR
jgi:predicted ArsR family transcriptional regulator